MRKIVVASDSFKGSLTSMEVAAAVEMGVQKVFPQCVVIKVEVADGGEGTVEAVVHVLGGCMRVASVTDPLGRPLGAAYGIIEQNGVKTAVLEMAATSGLPLLRPEERNPLVTSTYGTGQLIQDALAQGCRRFLIGVGGSATNDAGTGMLSALGVKFYDAAGKLLQGTGADLERIARIDCSDFSPEAQASEFIVACDVDTPFCGPNGAAHVFAPQKGATPAMVDALDRGLFSFARIMNGQFHQDVVSLKGAGAAGGLGGAFRVFLRARLTQGIEMVLDALSFDSLLQGADWVVTGEGRIDIQTTKGKTAAGVLRHALRCGVPTIALGGSVEMCPELEQMDFAGIYPIVNSPVPLEKAMQKELARANICRTMEQIMRTLKQR